MADTAAFPTIHDVLLAGDNIQSFVSAGTIKAGMVVSFADTGLSGSVNPGTQALGHVAGVALYDASSGEYVAVACDGCQVTVCEGAGAAIDAGHYVSVYGTTTTGTVIEYDPAIEAHAATQDSAGFEVVGQALDDISANSTGRIVIRIKPIATASS
jgi:hypothetical protein